MPGACHARRPDGWSHEMRACVSLRVLHTMYMFLYKLVCRCVLVLISRAMLP